MKLQLVSLLTIAALTTLVPSLARAEGHATQMCQDEIVQPLPLPPPPVEDVVSGVKSIARGLKFLLNGAGSFVTEVRTYLGAEIKTRSLHDESWNHVVDRLQEKVVTDSQYPPRQAGEPSLLNDEGYRREMAALFNSPSTDFVSGNKVELLVNGCASFEKREDLIDHAEQSIHMFVWAIYDDDTGREFSNWLYDAKNRKIAQGSDLDIKIIVDGNLAKEAGTRDQLVKIEAQTFSNHTRIQVVRLKDKHDGYFGMHRKLMIVDGRDIIMGGMNVGNIYSHLGPDPGGLWRDTDVHVTGPVVNQAEQAFADEWNDQVKTDSEKMTYAPMKFDENPGTTLSMIVDHQPLRDDNTYLAIMKSFYGATQSIDIENAYVIADPVNERAIMDALKRGVKVRILSNSQESIDEPVMTVPILQSLARLQKQGALVYLKKNYYLSQALQSKGPTSTTLHSKFFIVDGVFTTIGSYNFHPRSYRYEREAILVSFDENLARQMESVFESDITPDHATGPFPDELKKIKTNLFHKIIGKDFYDQL